MKGNSGAQMKESLIPKCAQMKITAIAQETIFKMLITQMLEILFISLTY